VGISRFSFPTLIHFGPGARKLLRAHLEEQGLRRPLVVTDKGLAALPVFKEILDLLGGGSLTAGQFTGIAGNPVHSQVVAGVEAFHAHKADSIVGLGGGAGLDVAKAIALMARHPGDLFDYEDDKPGARPIDKDIPYWVAIPTTAGTGSEVGRSAVISDEQTHVKKIFFSPRLMAKAVFADPELTLGLPPAVTAATGMDALTHCIEAFLAKDYHPIADGIALEGLRLGAAALPRAYANGSDLAARGDMMMSSMMGAIAFQKGLGLIHSMAHALSAVSDLHHGYANGVMIDHALKFNLESSRDRFARMAMTIGLKEHTGEAFLAWLRELKKQIGIPAGLSGTKVPREALATLPKLAFEDSCHSNNPCPCTEKDFRKIYEEAFV
jgi:alcohol dehydrogenase class IV